MEKPNNQYPKQTAKDLKEKRRMLAEYEAKPETATFSIGRVQFIENGELKYCSWTEWKNLPKEQFEELLAERKVREMFKDMKSAKVVVAK